MSGENGAGCLRVVMEKMSREIGVILGVKGGHTMTLKSLTLYVHCAQSFCEIKEFFAK